MPTAFDQFVEKKQNAFDAFAAGKRSPISMPREEVDFNEVLNMSDRYEIPYDMIEEIYEPLKMAVDVIPDPQGIHIEKEFASTPLAQGKLKALPEDKSFLEAITGFVYPAKPVNWQYASPIERFNFVTMPISDFLGRIGGKIASDWRTTTREEVQKTLAGEYAENLEWYQKSPELVGWGIEQTAEYLLMKGIFKLSGLHNVLTKAGQKVAGKFISDSMMSKGGLQTLKTLSPAGIRNILREGLVNFLASAPENTAFIASWGALDSALKGKSPKEIGEDAVRSAGWGAAITAGMSILSPLVKAPEVQSIFQKAMARITRKYPRIIDFVSKDVEQEIVDSTVKAYGEHIGQDIRFTELPKNIQAAFRNVARAVKKEVIKAAQKEEAVRAYWNAGRVAKEAMKTETAAIKEKPVSLAKPKAEPTTEAVPTKPPQVSIEDTIPQAEKPRRKMTQAEYDYAKRKGYTDEEISRGTLDTSDVIKGVVEGKPLVLKPALESPKTSIEKAMAEQMTEMGRIPVQPTPTAPAEKAPIFKTVDEAAKYHAEQIVDKLKVGEKMYVPPQFRLEVKGKSRLAASSQYLKDAGLIHTENLNYWQKPEALAAMPQAKEKPAELTPQQEVFDRIENPTPKGMRPGFATVPQIPVKEIAESIKNTIAPITKDVSDMVKALEFYPDVPNDLRNDIRTNVIGAIEIARDDVYNKFSNYLWGKMKKDDIQKSVELIYARDQVSRAKLGKGNPDISVEESEQILNKVMEESSSEIIAAADRWREVNQRFRDNLIRRGLLDEEQAIEDYAPHFVLDYTPDWKFNVGIPTRLKRPFRGYIKKAVGTRKEYQQDKDALLGSLLIQQHDNIIEDFIEKQCEKYNILDTLEKEKKIKLFGKDKAGRANMPKPGRIYIINDKRYRAYTPDIPFTRQLFPTEEGLMALGRYKNVSLIPEDIYNIFKGFSERGSRSFYLVNRATSIWKSMAILSHFPSFNVNNMVGDTWMALIQHPAPEKLLAEYSTAFSYLTGKGTGLYYDKLHRFIVEHNVLTGTFAASEMAQMRKSANPLAWLLEKTQEFSNFREGINRTAYVSTLLKAQEAGEAKDWIDYHNWINTEELLEDAALGKIARETLVDYGATSKSFKRYIRGGIAPFATWYVKGSKLIWSWAKKHWGKALATFMGIPVAATIYNNRSEKIRELEGQLPDYIRNRTHLVLGENPDGTIRAWSFQLPQDALIGTKIFSIATDYANRAINGEMPPKEAALKTLRQWGIKEAKGLAYLTAPLIRYITGRMSTNHRDPYDGAPIYSTDPERMTWWDRKKDEALFFIKTTVPFLTASISAHEKGQPTDLMLRDLLDRFAGKGALGIYDISKSGKLILERNGQKVEFDYDDVAKIKYIAAKEEHYLDKIEREFINSGIDADKFVETSLTYNELFKIYDLWSKFLPELKEQQFTSNQEKAHSIMTALGERFTNRLTDEGVIRKWYKVKIERAETDEEKIKLRKDMEQLQMAQLAGTIKSLPKTAREVGLNALFQESELPWELILTLP